MTTIVSARPSALHCLIEVQKLIAKYGLAAHLALLAVAPLFLFPFVELADISTTQLWLSLVSLVWMVMAPSVLRGERLQDARKRMIKGILKDPLAWMLLVAVVVSATRAANTGIALAYDAEGASWHVSSALFPILPGAVGAEGVFPFVAVLSASILVLGCRHALGRSARLSFLLLSSSLAGLAAVILHVAVSRAFAGAMPFVEFQSGTYSFVGFVFGIYFVVGVVALFVVVENAWKLFFLLPIMAIGGNGAACFSFAPSYLTLAVFAAALVVAVYMLFCAGKVLQSSGKLLLSFIGMTAVVLGVFLVALVLPEKFLMARLTPYVEMTVVPDSFWDVRRVVSAMAFKSWISHLWTGTGLGSFPLDFRFSATEADWTMLPRGAVSIPNGWWLLLAERGIVGIVFFLLPIGFLFVSYVRRMVDNFRDWTLPHPACLLTPVLLALLGAVGFVDCSMVRPEAMMICGAILSISALSFPRKRVEKNG